MISSNLKDVKSILTDKPNRLDYRNSVVLNDKLPSVLAQHNGMLFGNYINIGSIRKSVNIHVNGIKLYVLQGENYSIIPFNIPMKIGDLVTFEYEDTNVAYISSVTFVKESGSIN